MSRIKGIVSLLVSVAAMTTTSAWLFTRKTVFIEGIDYFPPKPKYVESSGFHMGFCGVTTLGNNYNSNYHHEYNEPDGEKLFKANCASCHHPTKVVVGPALQGTYQRWTNAGIKDRIYDWIRNPHDKKAVKLPYIKNMMKAYREKGVGDMTPQDLTNEEIDAAMIYADF